MSARAAADTGRDAYLSSVQMVPRLAGADRAQAQLTRQRPRSAVYSKR